MKPENEIKMYLGASINLFAYDYFSHLPELRIVYMNVSLPLLTIW